VVREAASSGYTQIIGMRHGVSGLLTGELVDLGAQPPDVLTRLHRTPSSALGATRHRPTDDELGIAVRILRQLDVRSLIYIGGNDSAETLRRIGAAASAEGYGIRCVHVPKTIDNDLVLTDHTPGYGSAGRHVAILTRDAGRDTEAMRHTDPVKLLEVPGRNAGWLAASSALAREAEGDAPHLIIPPETLVSAEDFLARIERALAKHGCAVVVVAETARGRDGSPIGSDDPTMGSADAFGHRRLSGAASYLSALVASRLKVRARWEKPGTLIRTSGISLSDVDLAEAEEVGRAGVRAADSGMTDVMVTLVREPGAVYRCTTGYAQLAGIANRERRMPAEYFADDGYDVSRAFVDYITPLVGGPLPSYGRLLPIRLRR